MKNLYFTFLTLISVILSQNVSAQCYGTKFTSKVVDSTKTATFTNTTTATFHKYSWTFGDGQTSTLKSPPAHKYTYSGLFWVELKGTDTIKNCFDTTGMWISVGCKADFSVSSDGKKLNYSTSKPGALKIRFDFGDGTSVKNSSGSHTYSAFGTYNVCLIVSCTVSDSTKACQSINIKSNCVAAFDIINKDSVGKTKFTFVNRSTYSPGMKYLWDLGDGGTATSTNVAERIYAVGTYNICLRITDTSKKCIDSICHTLNVRKHCDSGFYYSTKLDTLSYGYTGKAANVKLDFGDGKTSTSKTGTHVYGKLGNFNVCLTAYCSSTDSSKLCRSISMVKIPCKAKFTKSADTSQKFKIILINNSTNTSTTTYLWDMGDGGSSTSRNPTHKYNTFGKFRVCLTVKDSSCSSSFCDSIGLDSTGKLLKAGSFEVVVQEQTGSILNKKPNTDFKIYPNPASETFRIETNGVDNQVINIQLINRIGQIVMDESAAQHSTFNIHHLPQGVYLVKVMNGEKVWNSKLSIVK